MRRLIVQASVMFMMLATLFFASSAEATNDIRKLMMPGPLSSAHSKLEDPKTFELKQGHTCQPERHKNRQ